jgi:hypothetical protein
MSPFEPSKKFPKSKDLKNKISKNIKNNTSLNVGDTSKIRKIDLNTKKRDLITLLFTDKIELTINKRYQQWWKSLPNREKDKIINNINNFIIGAKTEGGFIPENRKSDYTLKNKDITNKWVYKTRLGSYIRIFFFFFFFCLFCFRTKSPNYY